MKRLLFSIVVPGCIALQHAVLPTPAAGQGLYGDVGGVTRDSASGQPVAQALITARNVYNGRHGTAISGSDGAFTIARLEPGLYEVAAARDGFIKSTANVEVAASGIYRVDFLLAADYPSAPTAKTAPPVVDAPLSVAALAEELDALKRRIGQLEAALQARTTTVASLSPATPVFPGTVSAPDPAPAPHAQAGQAAPAPAPKQTGGGRSGPIATPPTPVAPPDHRLPEALQAPDAGPAVDNDTPFAYGDFTWLNGTARTKDTVLDTKFFTPEVRFDTHYMEDFNQPIDHTIVGSTESFRSGEVQIEQASVGGDFHWENVRGRILFMEGLFATTTPRNDASSATGSAREYWRSRPVGPSRMLTSMCRKLTAGITSTFNTDSMSTQEFSCRTSACSVTTISITGLTSRRMCRRIRLGFSTACAFSGSQPTS